MIITNGLVYDSLSGFVRRELRIQNDMIADVSDRLICPATSGEKTLDAAGCFIIPGLIDVHFHGCAGHDFCDGNKASLSKIAEYELRHGVTAICPASMSLPVDELKRIFAAAADYRRESCDKQQRADLLGINMEGPFLSVKKKGAQNPDYIIKPDAAVIDELIGCADGLIKIIDIAPETEGASEIITRYSPRVRISLAHTECTYEQAAEAFRLGAVQLTHTLNTMPQIVSREPGPVPAALENEQVMIELITDGIHIHPAVVRMLFRLFGAERIVMISDSMEACGMPDGEYMLGGQKVFVKGRKCTLESGAIAGSASSLFDCLRESVLHMNIPLEDAVRCASTNPAVILGCGRERGDIREGYLADLLIVDRDMQLTAVIKNGEIVEQDIWRQG